MLMLRKFMGKPQTVKVDFRNLKNILSWFGTETIHLQYSFLMSDNIPSMALKRLRPN